MMSGNLQRRLMVSCGHVVFRQIKFGCVTPCVLVLYCYIFVFCYIVLILVVLNLGYRNHIVCLNCWQPVTFITHSILAVQRMNYSLRIIIYHFRLPIPNAYTTSFRLLKYRCNLPEKIPINIINRKK